MIELNKVYNQGNLCICSVQKKETGFEDYRFTAYMAATELGFYVLRNPENVGITQDDFERVLNSEYPVFILIIGNVESDVVSREFDIAKEYCLPLFVFIKKYNGIISKDSKKILEKLSKAAYDYQCTTFQNCEQLYEQVHARLSKYILEKRSISPKLQKGVGLAYRANKRIMSKSKNQIIIYQKTSILLLGPRNGRKYEGCFYRELIDWLKTMREDVEFLHVFNLADTIYEMKNNSNSYNLRQAKDTISDLYGIYETEGKIDKLNIRFSKIQNSVSYVIADTNLVFVIPIEDERYTIELPSHIMKMAEIEKIKDELYLQTVAINKNDINKMYEEVNL